MVMAQFGQEMNAVKALPIPANQPTAQLTVKYHHCGRFGKSRMLSLRNQEQKLLKQWKFNDSGEGITCSIQEITSIRKLIKTDLFLVYTSAELPAGRTILRIAP
jgi:hypothetical protein